MTSIAQDPEYLATASLDRLRETEYARLDLGGDAYLDYTGAGLYAESQLREHQALLATHVLGNPHSVSRASSATTSLVEGARRAVLDFFGAGDEYTAVFTANATGAIKLVAESFPFEPGGRLLLTTDNHNSINGIREFALGRRADVQYAPLTRPDLRLDRASLLAQLDAGPATHPRLFAFPAQSNFSGVRHPLDLVGEARRRGWSVLLDAAAFVPTHGLNLRDARPDFVSVSFYKMFGYPTGVGCLLARRDALAALHRPWFSGGTVNFATVLGRHHILSPGEAGFEDGTLNFLDIPAVTIGLRYLQHVGQDVIRRRVMCLTGHLIAALLELRHDNGRPLVRLYGPASTEMRGGSVTMNCYDPEGRLLDYRRIEELASACGISLRTGCFCNPGAGEAAEGLTADEMRAAASEHAEMTLPRFVQVMLEQGTGKSAGAMRVSLGIASNAADVQRLVGFLGTLLDQTRLTLGDVTFDIESCRIIRDGA